MRLPQPLPNQTYVTVSAIEAGTFSIPESNLIKPANLKARKQVPDLAFLITHPGAGGSGSKPRLVLFDLGLRTKLEDYPTEQQKHFKNREPYSLSPGVRKQLEDNGITAKEVDTVILSHVHWDHTGDPAHFPNSQFIVGSGSLAILANGLPGLGSFQKFEPDLLPENRTTEFPPPTSSKWSSIGDFRALDFFEDGSVYVLDAPGHLPGHVNLLCRVSDKAWVCLCGDAYHDNRLLTGEREFGTWEAIVEGQAHTLCFHLDVETAKRHVHSLSELSKSEGVELIAAHDDVWVRDNSKRLFPKSL